MVAAYASAAAAGVANLGSASVSPAKPSGVVAGDLLVAVCWSGAGAVCTWTAPAGWSAADASNSANGVGTYVFHRIADGTEGSSFTFTRSATGNNAGAMVVRITGADQTTPVAAAGVTGASSTTVVLPTVTASQAGTELLQLCLPISLGTFTWTPPAGAVQEAIIAASGTALNAMVGDETVGSGATGTRTWTHTTATTMRGAIVAINPATSTQSASVTMAGGGTMSVSGSQQIPAAVTITGGGAMTVSTGGIDIAAVTMPGGGTMSVSGRQTISAALTLTGGGTMAATPLFDPLSRIRYALANAATTRATIGIIAASITEGYPVTWDKTIEQRLAAKLRTIYGLPGSGAGFIPIPSTPVQGISTSPISWTGGTYNEAFGWGAAHGVWYTTPAQNGIWKLTLPTAASQVLIDILVGTAGNAAGGRYRINGGSWVTFNTLAGATAAATLTLTGSLAAGATIEVGYNAGTGNVVVTGARVSNGDESAGVQVHNYGHSAYTIAKWNAGTGGAPQWSAEIARHNLDLLILHEFGGNDGNSAGTAPLTAAQFQTALASYIDALRAAGITCDLLLVGYQDVSAGITFVEPWANYLTAIQAVATAKDAAYVSYGDHGIPASPSGSLYAADNVHGATNGTLYDLEAEVLAGLISRVQSEPLTFAGGGTMAVSGRAQPSAAVTITGGGGMAVSGQEQAQASLTVTGGGSMEVTGTVVGGITASVTISGGGSMALTAQVEARASVTITGAGGMLLTGVVQLQATLTLTGGGTMEVGALTARAAAILVTGGGTMLVSGSTGQIGPRTAAGPTWEPDRAHGHTWTPSDLPHTYTPRTNAHTVG